MFRSSIFRSSVARSVLMLYWIAVLVILGTSLQFAASAWRDHFHAREVVDLVTLDRTVFQSTAGVRLEIGSVSVALLRDDDPGLGVKRGLGEMADAWQRAEAALTASSLPDRDRLIARLTRAGEAFQAARSYIDAEAALPRAARDANRIEPWRMAVYDLAAAIDDMGTSVGRELRTHDLELGELVAIRQMSFTIRDRYSRQCSAFRPAVQLDTPLTRAARDRWHEHIGAYGALWTQMERIALQLPEDMGFAPLVAEGLRRTEAAQAIMTKTLDGLSGSGRPAFDAAAWSENCISAYSSILGIGSHALDLETRQADRSRVEAFRTGAISTAVLVLVGVLGFISLTFVRTRLSAPMRNIEAALATLRAGDLDTPIPVPPWNDEPSAIIRALEGFRLEALEARRMRLRIDQTRDELVEHSEKVGRTKSQFLANMSHEIRTPLHGILGTVRLLARSRVSDEQRIWVQALDQSGRLLRDILDDILDFTRLESGRVRVETAPFSLRERIAMVNATIRPAMERKGLDFAVTIDPELPDALSGDAAKLGQILLNLLGNAAKFTEHGGVRLTVAGDDRRPDRLRITVADTGIGIAPDALAHIFEPFSQADGSVARRFGGSGLGLAVCRGLLDALGGEIDLETEVGRGTTFTVLFPLGRGEKAAVPVTDAGDKLPDLHVLVAEDNVVNALIVRTMLERTGHRVRHVETGEDAVTAAVSEDFDVVLMDLAMPGLDGASACRRIRACGHPTRAVVPILAVSAGGASASDIDAGFDGRLEKPFHRGDLISALAEAIGLRSSRRERRRESLGAIGEQARDLGVEGARKLVALYLSSQPPLLAEAVAAVRLGDHGRARALAHRLKGAAAHVGADDMAAAAATLERAVAEDGAVAAAAEALATLGRTHFAAFAAHAEDELARLGNSPVAKDRATNSTVRVRQATFSVKT
jgi:signal transduction histidine kinase/HPt (histidine-containing phosphotransfer) domain-containing protein/ActR/RegA family two-component response regulator